MSCPVSNKLVLEIVLCASFHRDHLYTISRITLRNATVAANAPSKPLLRAGKLKVLPAELLLPPLLPWAELPELLLELALALALALPDAVVFPDVSAGCSR